jgi:hypothetical protein
MYSGAVAGPVISIPDWAWRRDETRETLRRRDVPALFRFAQTHGATQSKIAVATGLLQGRVSEIINGGREVVALEVFERIASGLGMPDDARMLFGLAPRYPAGLDHLGPAGRAEIVRVFPSQSAAADDIRASAATAHAVDIMAVRGLGIIGLNDSLLRERVVREQPKVRVLLLDPDSPAASLRAAEIGESVDAFTSGVHLAVARLRELSEASPVEVYLYASLPVWRLIAVDDVLYVSAFGEEWEGHESAMYKVAPTPYGALHRGFRREFEELRRNARRVV